MGGGLFGLRCVSAGTAIFRAGGTWLRSCIFAPFPKPNIFWRFQLRFFVGTKNAAGRLTMAL